MEENSVNLTQSQGGDVDQGSGLRMPFPLSSTGQFMPFGFPMIPPSVSATISHFCQTGDLKVSNLIII